MRVGPRARSSRNRRRSVELVREAGSSGDQARVLKRQLSFGERQPPAETCHAGMTTSDRVRTSTLYAPPPKPRGGPPAGPRPGDAPPVAAWRERMASDEGQAIYKQRAATSEWVNAGARGRGLHQMPVRGRAKAKAIALWHAVGHDLTRLIAPPAARPA